MFRASSSPVFSRLSALVVAACLASSSIAPAAHAQAKPAAKKPASSVGAESVPVEKSAAAAPKADKKTREAARKAYTDGEKAYAKGDYEAAHRSFQTALELIPSPHAEYWVAESLDKLARQNEAIAAYETFLANPGASKLGPDKVAEAKGRLESLKGALVGEVSVVSNPAGASVTVDGQPQEGVTPLSLKLPPGAHKVALTLAGHEPKEVEVNVVKGEKSEQKVDLAPEQADVPPAPVAEPTPAPAAEEPPPPREKRSKVPAYVTLGIAGAGAVVGTIFGLKALSAKGDYDDRPSTDGADDVERNALIADMAFGVAITLGVTGVVLLTSSDSTDPAPSDTARRALPKRAKLNVAPYVNPTGGGASARLTF
jgi:hypothetical protein